MEPELQALAEARLEYERQCSLDRQLLDQEKREKIMALVYDFPRIWKDPGTPVREKKRLVAMMIEDVTLTRGQKSRCTFASKAALLAPSACRSR